MWKYVQKTGELFDSNGALVDVGYAGKGSSKNNPGAQCKSDEGPIPRGTYEIGQAINHPKLGPVSIPLDPDPANNMCGRSGFFVHGDSASDPGNASKGCIILKRPTRVTIDASEDRELSVVADSVLSRLRKSSRRSRRSKKGKSRR